MASDIGCVLAQLRHLSGRWRAVDEHGFVQGVLLERHRDTEAAKTFLKRLLSEYDVPEVIHTDQLRSYGAAIREIPSLLNVDHQQVISTARCNNVIEQEHRSTRRQERSQQGFKRRKRAQEFLSLHARISGQAPRDSAGELEFSLKMGHPECNKGSNSEHIEIFCM